MPGKNQVTEKMSLYCVTVYLVEELEIAYTYSFYIEILYCTQFQRIFAEIRIISINP